MKMQRLMRSPAEKCRPRANQTSILRNQANVTREKPRFNAVVMCGRAVFDSSARPCGLNAKKGLCIAVLW